MAPQTFVILSFAALGMSVWIRQTIRQLKRLEGRPKDNGTAKA
ncbi:hypothetical protein [Pseudooctadecabacter jejudonensis]|nr:hypothetical protein [Pseudooctadecabacter jejudonensis]